MLWYYLHFELCRAFRKSGLKYIVIKLYIVVKLDFYSYGLCLLPSVILI